MTVRERPIGAVDPAAWDRFVIETGGSFLGSWKVIRAERFLHRIRVFDLYESAVPGATRIGQCAIAIRRGRARFLDRLHLLPSYAACWWEGIELVLARCGAATCTYGSSWNHEKRSPPPACSPPGRFVDAPFRIDCVELSAWPGFAAYRKAVSENIRRDYRKAAAASPVVVTRRGVAAWRDVPPLVGLRRQVMRRNREPFSVVADVPRHLLKLLCMGDDAFISMAAAQGRRHAVFFGVRFGDAIYYLGGGTEDRCEGFGSYLFLTLLEQWFAEHPGGRLYLGAEPLSVDPQTYTQGNLLYRRKLRATWVPGTAFTLAAG